MPDSIGVRFATAVAQRDAGALVGLLEPALTFQAMAPGHVWEADTAQAAVDVILGKWFAPEDRVVAVKSIETDELADVKRLAFRFYVTNPDGTFVTEYQAYLRTGHETISWLLVLSSGLWPRQT